MENRILLQLYEEYGHEIYRYLCVLSQNYSIAEELCQETFFKALLSLPQNHTNMRAWLYTVARNLYFNYRKQEMRLMPLPEPDKSCEGKDSSQDILEQFIGDERRRILYQAVSDLAPLKKEVIALQYFGGMGLKEIAAILHLTPENTRVLSHRAKKDLRKYLEGSGYDLS